MERDHLGTISFLLDELSDWLDQRPLRMMIGAALFKRRCAPACNGGRTQGNDLLAHRMVHPRQEARHIPFGTHSMKLASPACDCHR